MAKGQVPHTDGLLVVDKGVGLTSHDVVGKLRRIVGQKKIGHAGTLDPGATGVLLVGLGRATRLMQYVSGLPKHYVGQLVLGSTTTTLDDEGEVLETFAMDGITLDDVRVAAKTFEGDIEQIPPMVSAIKIGGKRLHELARQGIEVERAPRPVTIHSLAVEPTEEPHVFELHVQCSSGTYIRTLAADLGEALGGGAHLRRLRRTAIGSFSVDRAVTLETLEEEWRPHVQSPLAMVSHYPTIVVDDDAAVDIGHGKSFSLDRFTAEGEGPWNLVDSKQNLLAIYAKEGNRLRSLITLAAG